MRGLFFVSAFIVLAAVSAPSIFQQYFEGPDRSSRRSPARDAVAMERPDRPASAQHVEIEASRDGHFYVDAEINFRTVRLVVDTGATTVALRQSDAENAGIRVHPTDFQFPVQTANGTTSAAEAVLDSVAVTDVEVRNVRALILPDDQLAISLLGGSFLNAVERFEVNDGVLVIEN